MPLEKVPLVWSNDDITAGRAEQLQRQLEMLDRFAIPGVFFVIPRNTHDKTNIDTDPALLRVIEKARARGHEFYQHGFIHTPFESGVPETWMLDMVPEVRDDFDARRLEIEKSHTLDAISQMLDNGRAIWRRAFHEDSPGYRPGWGAFCGNLYQSLENLGFSWVSSRIPSPTSWKWNNGKWDEPMNFRPAVPVNPVRIGKLIEYPLGGDYAFNVPHEPSRIDAMVDLAMRETQHVHRAGAPMIICSHWHGLERNDNAGYAVHEKMLPQMLASKMVEPMNMTALEAWAKASPERILPA